MPLSLLDLDDSDALISADSRGALRSAALGGAQIRATASAVEEAVLYRLADLRPRSVVLVAAGGRAGRAAAMLLAALAAKIGVPLVHAPDTPPWVGPLDVVVVFGDDAGDPALAESVNKAVRRGSEVVLAAPDEGPLRSAGAGRAVVLPPRISVMDHNALHRYLAVGLAVVGSVDGSAQASELPELLRVADLVDEEALRGHPSNEVFRNPAKSLAARMQGRRVVLTGDTPATVELAHHCAEVLLMANGMVASAVSLSEVISARTVLLESVPTGDAAAHYDAFFHDDELDGPRPQNPVRVFVFALAANRSVTSRRAAAIPDAELILAGAADDLPISEREAVQAGERALSPLRSEIEQCAILATRLEMAAAYLHLMGGS